jgi:hypothetical protein
VTHHPEEIVPGITHVLLLRDGAVVASGPRAQVLTEGLLTETYGLPLRLVHEAGRVWMIPLRRGTCGDSAAPAGRLKLVLLDGEFAVARLAANAVVPPWSTQGSLSAVTRTPEELSIVCAATAVPPDVRAERGWRCLRVVGPLDFSLTGVLTSITGPLAAAKLSLLAFSTYDTDYVLVRGQALTAATACLRAAGHEVVAR